MCTTLYFYLSISDSLLSAKNCFHPSSYSWYPLLFALPHSPPPLVTTTLFSVFMCLFWFGLFINFLCFFIFPTCVKSYGICLSLSDLFHLAWCPQGPSMLSHMTSFHLLFSFLVSVYSLLMEPHAQACTILLEDETGWREDPVIQLSQPNPRRVSLTSQAWLLPGIAKNFPPFCSWVLIAFKSYSVFFKVF